MNTGNTFIYDASLDIWSYGNTHNNYTVWTFEVNLTTSLTQTIGFLQPSVIAPSIMPIPQVMPKLKLIKTSVAAWDTSLLPGTLQSPMNFLSAKPWFDNTGTFAGLRYVFNLDPWHVGDCTACGVVWDLEGLIFNHGADLIQLKPASGFSDSILYNTCD